MPTFKKYSGIKTCEDYVQRLTLNQGQGSSGAMIAVRPLVATDGVTYHYLPGSVRDTSIYLPDVLSVMRYLSADSITASIDDYTASDYLGNSTGSCTFVINRSSSGVQYAIQFNASENASIKCFKFFKNLKPGNSTSSYGSEKTVLMFAVYFDSPISVSSGDILNMSLNFAYDDQQVAII